MKRFSMSFRKGQSGIGFHYVDMSEPVSIPDGCKYLEAFEHSEGEWVRWEDVKELVDIGEKLDDLPEKVVNLLDGRGKTDGAVKEVPSGLKTE